MQPGTFRITYKDDDGDQIAIVTPQDLAEAIAYFNEGESSLPSTSRQSTTSDGADTRKITMRVHVTVDYSGPSLSEPGSSENGALTSSSFNPTNHYVAPVSHHNEYGNPPPRPPKPLSYKQSIHQSGDVSGPRATQSEFRNGSHGRPDIRSARRLQTAPPGYSSNSTGSSQSSDERRELEWLRAQEERLTYFSRARDRPTSMAARNGLQSHPQREDGSQHPSASRRGDDRARGITDSNRILDMTAAELPNFLSELRLSRPSAPSVLSSLPDELLRCCACSRELVAFRYVCCLCGPILPDQASSDDGTQVLQDIGDSVPDDSASRGDVSSSSSSSPATTPTDSTVQSKSAVQEIIDDPLGVNASRSQPPPSALPLIQTETLSSPTGHAENGHVHNPTSPLCSPILTLHAESHPAGQVNLTASAHELAHHRHGEEDRGGFELCSDCVETEGVKHARMMYGLAREADSIAAARSHESIGHVELRHAFVELCRMGKSSVQQGWREVGEC